MNRLKLSSRVQSQWQYGSPLVPCTQTGRVQSLDKLGPKNLFVPRGSIYAHRCFRASACTCPKHPLIAMPPPHIPSSPSHPLPKAPSRPPSSKAGPMLACSLNRESCPWMPQPTRRRHGHAQQAAPRSPRPRHHMHAPYKGGDIPCSGCVAHRRRQQPQKLFPQGPMGAPPT